MTKIMRAISMAGVTFEIGDRIEIISDCSGTLKGDIYTLQKTQYGKLIATNDTNSGSGCTCINNWEKLDSEWDK